MPVQHTPLPLLPQGYTKLLRSLGNNVAIMLSNLNNLHLHLTMGFPSMVAPAFRVEEVRHERGVCSQRIAADMVLWNEAFA